MQREVPLATNTAEQDVAGSELLINCYPRLSVGKKYEFNLVNAPGLAYLTELPTFPIKALHKMGDRAFAFTPNKMYEIFIDGTYTELGDVDLQGMVSTADNGFQVVAVDGIKGYYFDDNISTVSQIVDAAFYPAHTVAFQDGYFIFERTGTRQFFISGLLDVTFDALDYATKEGQSDNLVAVVSNHRDVFLFGTDSTEPWYNSGNADFPFQINQGAFIEKGCASRHTIAKLDNTVYFVGSDLVVYGLLGYSPQRISNHAVEKTLSGVSLDDAFAYSYQDGGNLFYVLTIPQANITWAFDASTSSWHIKKDKIFTRHRANNAIQFQDKTISGDYQSGRIYIVSRKYYLNDTDQIEKSFTLPTIDQGRERFSIDSFELDMSSGDALPGQSPKARLEVSKDKGNTFSSQKIASIGKTGEYLTRVKWNRLGTARQFSLRVTISDPIELDIGGAFVEVS